MKLSFSQMLFQSNSCFVAVNISAKCPKFVRNGIKSVRKLTPEIKRPNFVQVM